MTSEKWRNILLLKNCSMHRLLLLAAVLCVLNYSTVAQSNGGEANQNTLSKAAQNEGWKLLFDGTTKKGWHVFNNKTDGSAWKVENGALYLDPKAKGPKGEGGGDIVSEEAYENFHLKLDWKIDSAGNSGVIIQAQEDSTYRWPWLTGPEIQIVDNNAHPDAKIKKHRASDLYDLISASTETSKPAGQWNTMEIMQNKGRLEVHLNGTKVISTTQWDENWAKLISESKFKSMRDFGKFRKGKVALQDHGDRVWFRNIMIKSL
jgi:hypothetical protein